MPRLALCLLLLCFAAGAHARDIPLHGPNGDGGSCSDEANAPLAAQTPAAKAAPAAASRNKSRTPTTLRSSGGGGDDSGLHAPRWHSFLPGMFR
jgi:hypothetical protein